ncbi:DUF5997 family protein [Tomitella biformata]|uniref:DUF5997 family protein n=1 Tax=Tomitella biformata TaxID=630403 RepID=UPI00046530B3|nr:DUF5997 family protein [Tomitella biformata]
MTSSKKTQILKPATAAKKLGIYLPAAPESFRTEPVTRESLAALLQDPPVWLTELRATGPHPRQIVAEKLGVSISGLARSGLDEALTTSEIDELMENRPDWLRHERDVQAGVRSEARRLKSEATDRQTTEAEAPSEG